MGAWTCERCGEMVAGSEPSSFDVGARDVCEPCGEIETLEARVGVLERALDKLLDARVAGTEKEKFRAQRRAAEVLRASPRLGRKWGAADHSDSADG